MFDKEEAKKKIAALVENYSKLEAEGKASGLNESDAKAVFIEPLFDALGWNTKDVEEVSREASVSRGRADYAFRLSGVIRFFVEAKAAGVELEEEEAQQAINYAYYKSVPWVVLTNFRQLVIYNAEARPKRGEENRFLRFGFNEYIARFEELSLLCRENAGSEEISRYAERVGRKFSREPVTKELFQQFMKWRSLLSRNVAAHDLRKKLTKEDIDEGVQRFLNRFVFVRTCEDRKLENEVLRAMVRESKTEKKRRIISHLRDVIDDFRDNYDSDIFFPHMAGELSLDDGVVEQVINELYDYDFSAIDADVLGSIYEQYLATIMRAGGALVGKEAHRKEMGIYYTPTYIVDYIVKNTLGELISKTKSAEELEKIRILDPACGSGSFLIRAYEMLNDAYQKRNGGDHEMLGENVSRNAYTILTKNLHGVDLDKKAVEIVELNLLLRAARRKGLLPPLSDNIKQGNSLISGTEEELEKYFGDRWREKHPFNWEEQFAEVMKEGGFDVVVGNPPWVSFGLRGTEKLDKRESMYYRQNYSCAEYKLSTYALFIERSIHLLREGGFFSFIVPDSFLLGRYFSKLRCFILDNCRIKSILLTYYDVFSGKATTGRNVVIVLQKTSDRNIRLKNRLECILVNTSEEFHPPLFKRFSFSQAYFESSVYNRLRLFFNEKDKNFVEHIESDSVPLGTFMVGHTGVRALIGQKNIISKNRKTETWKRGLISGSQIGRYWLEYDGDYININPKLLNKGGWDSNVILNDKIMIRQTGDRLYATIDKEKYYHLNNIHSFSQKSSVLDMRYILALLNSKMMSAYYLLTTLEKKRPMAQTDIETLEKLPINVVSAKQQPIINLVDKMLSLNKSLTEMGNKPSAERQRLEDEIKRTDREIDELVYELYGITDEERKIIEESLAGGSGRELKRDSYGRNRKK